MRRVVLVLTLLALAAPIAATGERTSTAKSPPSVLAVQTSKGGDSLVRLNGSSLAPSSKRLKLGGFASYAYAFSPDGRRLAIGVDRLHGFRIVDVRSLKNIGRVQTWSSAISILEWMAPRRIIGYEQAGFFAVDPVTRRKLRSPDLTGSVQAHVRVGNSLVVLLAPSWEIGPARLAVLDAQGNVRAVQLDGIKAGAVYDWGGAMRGESHVPGLAVDPAGRALVVGTGGEPVAEVDLKSLAVTYHRPAQSRSLLSRFRNWLEPAAAAKGPVAGSFRKAFWLGDGRFAFWGSDTAPVGTDRVETTPAGLSIVDTNGWTIRTVDAGARRAAFLGGTLLASDGVRGLTAYSSGGQRLYRLFDGEDVGVVATFGSRAFVAASRGPIRVVDVTSGRLLGTRSAVPRLLNGDFCWW